MDLFARKMDAVATKAPSAQFPCPGIEQYATLKGRSFSHFMKVFQLMFKRETVVPMLALSFASIVSVALVIGRMVWLRDTHFGFLIWNLFLAWMPMVFALLARDHQRAGASP